VTFSIAAGETLGIVGESGSGKSTAGRVVLGLVKPTAGHATVDGVETTRLRHGKAHAGHIQVVLQNPDWSLNPSIKIGRSVAEPLVITRRIPPGQRREVVRDMLAGSD